MMAGSLMLRCLWGVVLALQLLFSRTGVCLNVTATVGDTVSIPAGPFNDICSWSFAGAEKPEHEGENIGDGGNIEPQEQVNRPNKDRKKIFSSCVYTLKNVQLEEQGWYRLILDRNPVSYHYLHVIGTPSQPLSKQEPGEYRRVIGVVLRPPKGLKEDISWNYIISRGLLLGCPLVVLLVVWAGLKWWFHGKYPETDEEMIENGDLVLEKLENGLPNDIQNEGELKAFIDKEPNNNEMVQENSAREQGLVQGHSEC